MFASQAKFKRLAYTPQKAEPGWGGLSKIPLLFCTGREANAVTRKAACVRLARIPSKLSGTLGPSRRATSLPEPKASSSRPMRNVTAELGRDDARTKSTDP